MNVPQKEILTRCVSRMICTNLEKDYRGHVRVGSFMLMQSLTQKLRRNARNNLFEMCEYFLASLRPWAQGTLVVCEWGKGSGRGERRTRCCKVAVHARSEMVP
jgi:hypothetical protein